MHQRSLRARPRARGPAALTTALLIGIVLGSAGNAGALVITEIMYHSHEPVDGPYEFIELYNENLDPLDLSGYSFCNGVSFTFPPGTWIDGRSYLVVCANESVIRAKYGITNTIGNWTGALDNSGERLELCNPGGISVINIRYNDRGAWPSGADGTGHSLSLISPFRDPGDPDSWTLSLELGGTPGADNGHEIIESGPPPSGTGLDGAGFILGWLVLGPYTGAACNLGALLTQDWLRESAGGVRETDLLWAASQVVNTNYTLAASTGLHANAGSATPRVKEYTSFSDTINFNDSVWPPDPNQVMGYAFVYVDNMTANPLAVDIACASDDAISVMVNGSYVHVNDACRGVGGSGVIQDRAPATLAAGKNLITVKVFENGGGWAFRLRLEGRGTGNPITSNSIIRLTTDHTKGLRFGGGGDPIEPPPPPPPPGELPGASPVILSEGFFRTSGERWVELYNRSDATVDLSGYYLTDDPSNLTKARIPAGNSIPARGWRSFTEVALGLDFTPALTGGRVFVALVEPSGTRVADAYNFEPQYPGMSEARYPDGDKEFSDAADPTRNAANLVSANRDIVINEVMYHPIDDDHAKEYVELYNRGSQTVSLTGWRFSNGINYAFPAGTAIAAGGYLVVARNPALIRSIYGLSAAEVVGPEQTPVALAAFGRLRDSGERLTLKDDLGRTANTIRYHDGGEWPRWADGLGSSLELIDPRQDNRSGQAWDASDDSAKAETRTYSYIGRHGGGESELAMILLSRGITLVDDVQVIGGGIQRNDTPLIEAGEVWRYFKGTQEPPSNWTARGFNDTTWLSGPTGIGYGDNDDVTVLTDMQGSYMTIFCRRTFSVADRSAINELILSIVVDDGFYAYLNGTQVASYNVSSPAFDAAAPSAIEPLLVERDISSFKDLLVNGTNVLAVQVHNAGINSSDLSFIPRLLDRTTTVTGGSNQVVNGHFNSNVAGWIIEGTHIRSGRTTQNAIAGAGSLKIIASGRGDNKVNRIETPDAGDFGLGVLNTGEDLQISFKARWVVGSQTLLTHGYQHAMARAHALAVPPNLGTPGRINSVTQRQITRAGSSNLGPVISRVSQDPAVPGAGEAVTIRARVLDSDGVSSVTLRYSLTNPAASPASVTMTAVGNGMYQGTIPGQPLGTTVVFFLTATDTGGRPARYPVDITTRTHPLLLNPPSAGLNDLRYCVYRHDARLPATNFHSYRFYMTQANQDELSNRRLLSNDLLDGSFVFGSRRIYHESAIRFSGSPFARGGWGASFRVVLPRDKLLHERIRKFNLDNHHGNGGDARERISHYLIRKNQGSIQVPYSDAQTLVRWQVNDRITSILEHVWAPDVQFLSLWYPDDDDGDFFEMDDRFIINDQGQRVGNNDARVLYPPPSPRSDGDGANKENYRWFFGLRAKNGADDYSSLIELARVLDPGVTSNALFDEQVWDIVNVEQMLRVWAVRLNTDDWDQWGASRGKNCYLYRPELDGRFNLLPWDLELTYGNVNSFLIPTDPAATYNPGGFAEVNRMFNRPKIRRMYYSILNEMVNGSNRWFHSSHLATYMSKLAAIGMTNTGIGQPGGFIDQRAALLQPRIQSVIYPQVRLRITTNGGNDIVTAQLAVNLAGTAPVNIGTIVVSNNSGEGFSHPTAFSSITGWSMTGIPLAPGANNLVLLGFDLRGDLVDSATIRVTSTAGPWQPPSISAVDPVQAPSGEQIEIRGSNFRNGVRVFFGATAATGVIYDENGPNPGRILATVPGGSGSVQVTVRNLDGQTSNGMSFTYIAPPAQFIRGDANRDSVVSLSDAVRILLHLFGGLPVSCPAAADADGNDAVNLTDPVYVLEFIFRGGPPPPAPFPSAGPSPAGMTLGCD
jgi:hypothetical protein